MSSHEIGRQKMSAMTLGALGVVFGDIGTSPLYAFIQCFHTSHNVPINEANVLGILSLIFWALMIVVSLKFSMLIMRADNHGEGGILALLALNMHNKQIGPKVRFGLITIGLFGASLFFGDGIITPAISVLSAVEGLSVATPIFTPYVIPITIVILIGLFMIQKKGTGSVGRFFGPIMLLWFFSIGFIGLSHIIKNPYILNMLNPYWALPFIENNPVTAFVVMGAVVLTITGGEALYADMGHFGRKPIQLAWFLVALPCLVLNYAGQGALILQNPQAIENTFFMMVPKIALYPMIALATAATVIASQAVISGVFSMARQAIQLGYLPRFAIDHTSESEIGQIYIPALNWMLLGMIMSLVLMFQSSANLGSAYGIAVTLTMFCDTILVAFIMYHLWKWPSWVMLLVAIPLLIPDLLFIASTSLKIVDGGWFPLMMGAITFIIMTTWRRGRELLLNKLQSDTMPLDLFIKSLESSAYMVSGTAVFMTSSPKVVPHALLHNLKHNKILHERNILITINTRDIPYVDESERIDVEVLDKHFLRVSAYYGFKEQPNGPQALEQALTKLNQPYNIMDTSFFVSRERVIHNVGDGIVSWREKLFISMQLNTSPASDFFQIPANRVVEMGSQVEI
ncbi:MULTISPECIES: potassium transporter Kup [Acinetobacter]|jgi:KUP system potassium uptake protein|nr:MULTISPECIES: potassium transporter Kup [Acinetobacter]MDQ9824475.1 potassium transporter Kup [Acinetobacter sp. 163]SSR42760.1 putative potassium transport system protein kup [Acinetobacter baumannii]EHU1208614.1 potassium transporter Kup [Acinetobacter nosocomialis]EXH13265.1 potassium uptake protein [Acinetobacter sp. 1245593]EXR31209.1 potassium uptake protein [Acinetobacter sp. 1281984]